MIDLVIPRRLLLAALCATVPLLAGTTAPATAQIHHRSEVQEPRISGVMRLPSNGGYAVTLSLSDNHLVELEAFRTLQEELGGWEAATYAVRQETELANGDLQAEFGSVGYVSLRFEPSGRRIVGSNPPACKGRRPVTELGSYRGAIELRGESGYFEVKADFAKGMRRRDYRLVCQWGQAKATRDSLPLHRFVVPSLGFGTSGKSLEALLRVEAEAPGRRVTLRAAKNGGGLLDRVSVGVLEVTPEMAIGRESTLFLPIGPLKVVNPTTASFGLSAEPEATYVETSPGVSSWTGTLAVDLPGFRQPLTGPEFRADLCVRESSHRRNSCVRADRRLLLDDAGTLSLKSKASRIRPEERDKQQHPAPRRYAAPQSAPKLLSAVPSAIAFLDDSASRLCCSAATLVVRPRPPRRGRR